LILLEHIWKSYGQGRKKKDVLCGIDALLEFAPGNIGILGSKHSGKTTLLNILAGIIPADSGRVRRRMRVSWPLSWRGFAGGMTGDAHVAFISRLYQAPRRGALRYVAELSQLERKLYEPVGGYSAAEKNRLMLALALALDFDAYLVDEIPPPVEPRFVSRYEEAWQERRGRSMKVIFSSQPERLAGDCSLAAILQDGELSAFIPTTDAAGLFTAMLRQQGRLRRRTHAKQN
jgi:capsular polysaccharide transport system ATP-binding protein